MRRTLTLPLLAAALLAVATVGRSEPVSQYQKTSYSDGGVVLRMNAPAGSVLNPGEAVSFTYQTREDACVLVFDIDSQGYVHLLYPSSGEPTMAVARQSYAVPEDPSVQWLVSGETGVEFVFALAVPDRSHIDEDEVAWLIHSETQPPDQRYRINGDPFLAANIIAGELVRGISHRSGIFFDYTYFYVNERVDHPCYLCGECDGQTADPTCSQYRFEANFPREASLTYPLRRAYDMIDVAQNAPGAESDQYETGDDSVDVTFYPYSCSVNYLTRPWVYNYDLGWYNPFWWDPCTYGWVYAPGWYDPIWGGWSFSWAWWGGTWYSGWYWPRHGYCYDYYHGYYHDWNSPRHRVGFKSQYASNRSTSLFRGSTLLAARSQAVRRDARLRIGESGLRHRPVGRQDLATKVRGARSARGRSLAELRTTRVTNLRREYGGRVYDTRGRYERVIRSRSTHGNTTYRPRERNARSRAVQRPSRGRSAPAVRSNRGSTSHRSRSAVKSRGGSTRSRGSSAVRRSGGRSRSAPARSSGRGRSGGSHSRGRGKK